MARAPIGAAIRRDVLTEAGYRCAVPTCRSILAIDLHHLVRVADGGENTAGNLIALCPTCHALHYRGTITNDSLYAWKGMLVALSQAFDTNTIEQLIFLNGDIENLKISGDGVLRYDRLIAAGLAAFNVFLRNGPIILYDVGLTQKGVILVDAWKSGDREALQTALAPPPE